MDRPSDGHGAVTGVAKGSLGTGTALDETQEWVVPPELQATAAPAAAPPTSEPASPSPAAASPSPAAASPSPTVASASPTVASATPAGASATPAAVPSPQREAPPPPLAPSRVAPRRTGSSLGTIAASPRTAGVAAAVALALLGVVAMVTSQDREVTGPGAVPAEQATTIPTDAPAEADGVGGDGTGRDKDKGKGGGSGNGRGNGNGNGGGRGND